MASWLSWLERRPVTAEVEGSSPSGVVNDGILAQLGEHLPYKQRVTGSSPVGPIFYSKDTSFVYSGGFPSGQRGQTVNLLALSFGGSNPPPPILSLYNLSHWLWHVAGWSSLEARRAHNPEVIGSNPIPAIISPDSSVGRAKD